MTGTIHYVPSEAILHMMRTSTIWTILVTALLAHGAPAGAQTPDPAPPKLEQVEEITGAPITVTTQPDERKKITEKREQGRVTEVKVTSGKSTYYLKPNSPGGTAAPGNVSGIRGPQWQVMEFDLSKKKQKDQDAADGVPAPPQAAPAQ